MAEETNVVQETAAEAPVQHFKKSNKKARYAMMMSYQGKNYFGMQIQKTEPTIEKYIIETMLKNGVINENEAAKPYSFYFQRAARTDRAVSAVRQICSMQLQRMDELESKGPEVLNKDLPKDIRIMGIKRTVPSYHAQKSCDARTYSYTLPTFAFAELDKLTTNDYRISKERIDEVNEVLKAYIGTHNFFNYTSRKDHDDRSCYRYIKHFECIEPFIFHDAFRNVDTEFITIYVKGQSFILHQIRKMMGMVISVVRGLAYQSDVLKSFESKRMDVPRAPGLGLLLEKLHYDVYEKRYSEIHGSLNDWGEEIESNVKNFRDEYIVSEILKAECSSQGMMMWLSSLVSHKFACDPEDDARDSTTQLFEASNVAAYPDALERRKAREAAIKEEETDIQEVIEKAAEEANEDQPSEEAGEVKDEVTEEADKDEDEPEAKKARVAC